MLEIKILNILTEARMTRMARMARMTRMTRMARPLARMARYREATKLQPLPQDRMGQQTVSKEACKLCLNAAISQELISYIKNSNY